MKEDLLALHIGGRSVRENLALAIEKGLLLRHTDGTLRVPQKLSTNWWSWKSSRKPLSCQFLLNMVFKCAYDCSCVPFGCRNCYKVKVVPRTLRELVALRGVMKGIDCNSKCGIELDSVYSQNIYSCLFYASGLEDARNIFYLVQDAMDATPELCHDIPMFIKRGCSIFEACCGPSDKYTFRPELPELELQLKSLYKFTPPVVGNMRYFKHSIMMNWIRTAYKIGDETYLEFNGGKRLFPKSVTYPSNAPLVKENKTLLYHSGTD